MSEPNQYKSNLSHPPPPKPPHQASEAELDSGGLNPQLQQERQHRELCKQIDNLTTGQSDLKLSVDRLARARCVDKWILIVGAISAIAAVIAAIEGLI